MVDIRDVQAASEETSQFLGRTQASHQRLILNSIRKLEGSMIDAIRGLQTAPKGGKVEGLRINLKQAQGIHKDLINIVDKQYNTVTRRMVNDFDSISKHIEQSYRSLGEAAKFTGIDREMIDTLKNDTYEQFKEFGTMAQDRASRAMYDTVISQGKFSDLVATIGGILSPHKNVAGKSMASYADQYAFDSVMNFHNKVNISKAEDLDMEHFLYVGDIIATTRSFCSMRAGRVYTREQIESWTHNWTGKAGPAMTYRGGYRCRHHWRPIRPEWMGGRDRVDIGDWNLEQIGKKFKGSVKNVAGKISPCSAISRAPLKRSVNGVGGYVPSCR
jgi:gas vesicle protein